MREFTTENNAIEYAKDNIGKYDDEIVLIDGKYTMLCSTGLPIREHIRDHIETTIEKLLDHIDWDGRIDGREDDFIDDAICYCGARATETIIEVLKEYGVNIISAGLEY